MSIQNKKMKDRLLLIDANSLIHRAFHALPSFKTPNGEPSGALYGLASMLIRVLRENPPRWAAAAFDTPEPTFRKKEYKEYKATRAPVVSELVSQLGEAENLFSAFGIKSFKAPGFEADDIIATLAHRFAGTDNLQVVILSGDLDTLQMVNGDKVIVEFPKKGISQTVIYDRDAVKDRFDIKPSELKDYKGLAGDSSDNIPGVPGIGPKTAAKLINQYGPLEKMYKEIEEIGMADEKLRKKLMEYKDQALLSKKLATLVTNVPVEVLLGEIETARLFNKKNALAYAKHLGSETLASRIENDLPNRYNS